MTTREILVWIHLNLRASIDKAIEKKKSDNPALIYTPEWLAAITYREVGELIRRYVMAGTKTELMHTLMRGDFSQRAGEKEKRYHGYGYTQIDIGSYPEFAISGDWKDPLKCYLKAIDVLESKRHYIERHMIRLGGDNLYRAITSAFNCGEGNVVKALAADKDVDYYTTGHNYSLEVWQRKQFYNQIVSEVSN